MSPDGGRVIHLLSVIMNNVLSANMPENYFCISSGDGEKEQNAEHLYCTCYSLSRRLLGTLQGRMVDLVGFIASLIIHDSSKILLMLYVS